MTLRRTLATASASLLLLVSLTACFGGGLPTTGGDTPTTDFDLTGTSWSGTDSDGDFWGFEFQSDGTVGLTYNEDTYDDPADVWKVSGSTLTCRMVLRPLALASYSPASAAR